MTLRRLAGLPTPAVRAEWAQDYAQVLYDCVSCKKMRFQPALTVANLVVQGQLDETEVNALIGALDDKQLQGELRGTRSQYFNGAINAMKRRAGIDIKGKS